MTIETLEAERQKIYGTDTPIVLDRKDFNEYLEYIGKKTDSTRKTHFRGHKVVLKEDV